MCSIKARKLNMFHEMIPHQDVGKIVQIYQTLLELIGKVNQGSFHWVMSRHIENISSSFVTNSEDCYAKLSACISIRVNILKLDQL